MLTPPLFFPLRPCTWEYRLRLQVKREGEITYSLHGWLVGPPCKPRTEGGRRLRLQSYGFVHTYVRALPPPSDLVLPSNRSSNNMRVCFVCVRTYTVLSHFRTMAIFPVIICGYLLCKSPKHFLVVIHLPFWFFLLAKGFSEKSNKPSPTIT